MARVSVTLNGRNYTVACEDGQEPRVLELAAYVDERLRQVAAGAPAGSEAQLLVLTSLLLADELFDLRDSRADGARTAESAARDEETVIAAVDLLARRIEDIAAKLDRT